MVTFVRGQPVETREPVVAVDAGLEPGVHRFTLVTVDDAGRESQPAEWQVQVVTIIRPPIPTGPVDPLRPTVPIGPADPLRPTVPIGPVDHPLRPTSPIRPAGLVRPRKPRR